MSIGGAEGGYVYMSTGAYSVNGSILPWVLRTKLDFSGRAVLNHQVISPASLFSFIDYTFGATALKSFLNSKSQKIYIHFFPSGNVILLIFIVSFVTHFRPFFT